MNYPGSVVRGHKTTMDTIAKQSSSGKGSGKPPAFNSGAASRMNPGVNYGAVRKRTSNFDGSGANAHSNIKNPGQKAPGSKKREVYK